MTLVLSSISYTQTVDSTGSVVTINGKKYVLVSERTFGQIEKLIKEVPALREESASKSSELDNANKIIEKDTQIQELKEKENTALRQALDATEKARDAQAKRAESEITARAATEKALAISEAEAARQKKRGDKWRNRTFLAAAGAVAFIFLGRP